mmetsp:Transcript_5892/g.24873  ORF Transcript_5892/g.24873 Transcript_5892/m.24873 type:complete len:188 (-) Transcript_5892:839-1402(-)
MLATLPAEIYRLLLPLQSPDPAIKVITDLSGIRSRTKNQTHFLFSAPSSAKVCPQIVWGRGSLVAIVTDVDNTSVQLGFVESRNGFLSSGFGVEDNGSYALGATIGSTQHVRPDDLTARTEYVLQLLPSNLVRQICDNHFPSAVVPKSATTSSALIAELEATSTPTIVAPTVVASSTYAPKNSSDKD